MASVFWIKVVIFGTAGFLLSFIDARTFRLPHVLTLPLAGTGLLLSFLPGNGLTPGEAFLGFASGLLPLGLLSWKRPATFGFGDAVFAGAIGAFAGPSGLGTALVVGGFSARVAFHLRKGEGFLPFGPFLAAGGMVGLLLLPFLRKLLGI